MWCVSPWTALFLTVCHSLGRCSCAQRVFQLIAQCHSCRAVCRMPCTLMCASGRVQASSLQASLTAFLTVDQSSQFGRRRSYSYFTPFQCLGALDSSHRRSVIADPGSASAPAREETRIARLWRTCLFPGSDVKQVYPGKKKMTRPTVQRQVCSERDVNGQDDHPQVDQMSHLRKLLGPVQRGRGQ